MGALKFKILLLSISLMSICGISYASINKATSYYGRTDIPDKEKQITYQLVNAQYYFSAIPFILEHVKKGGAISPALEKLIEKVAIKTGVNSFGELPIDQIKKSGSATLAFAGATHLFDIGNFSAAMDLIALIPNDHVFAPEAILIKASILDLQNKKDEALKTYQECITSSGKVKTESNNIKRQRYFQILAETCQIHMGRIYYKNKEYDKAIKAYNLIDKRSYKWPYILMEKAWSYYKLQDYNRTLGILVTYNSPLLATSYFFPESEILKTLSYHKLCLWNDAYTNIDQYLKVSLPKGQALQKFVVQNINTPEFFLNLMEDKQNRPEYKLNFIPELLMQIKKSIKYNLDSYSLEQLIKEETIVKRLDQKQEFNKYISKFLNDEKVKRRADLNNFAKKQFIKLTREITVLLREMYKVRIDISARKRELIYKKEELIKAGRTRGDADNIQRESTEHFWKFDGEFWADELGDYSFGLKSNCDRARAQGDKK